MADGAAETVAKAGAVLTVNEKVLVDAIARLSLEVAAEQRKSEALVVERGDCIRSMRAALEQLALGDKDEAARHLRGMLRLMEQLAMGDKDEAARHLRELLRLMGVKP